VAASRDALKFLYFPNLILNVIIGWYVPKYVVNDIPQVLFGDFSPDVAAYLNNTFVLGDIDWGGPERRVINDFNFSLNVEVLGGEEDMVLMLFERYAKQEPMLFYFWRPHPLHSVFDLMRITLPNDSKYLIKLTLRQDF
jgi:glycine betaine/proline transport system substrate-binding protein